MVSSSFLGTNNLIRQGATPVFSPNDILDVYYAQHFDKLGNVKPFPNDEILRRTQGYLTKNSAPKNHATVVEKPVATKKSAPDYLTESAKMVYDFLDDQPKHIDEIINGCGLTTEKTLSAVTELEIYGLVQQLSGRRYKIN